MFWKTCENKRSWTKSLFDKQSPQERVEGNDVSGHLCIAQATPGLARTVYGDHDRYIKTYFSDYPGYYFSGKKETYLETNILMRSDHYFRHDSWNLKVYWSPKSISYKYL